MSQVIDNTIRVESSRLTIGLMLVLMTINAGVCIGLLCFCVEMAASDHGRWAAIVLGSFSLVPIYLMVSGIVRESLIRKLRTPDVLEFSPDAFRFLNGREDFSATWNQVSEARLRFGRGGSTVDVAVAGKSLELRRFEISARTLTGLINEARLGHVMTPGAWEVENTDPGQISQLKGAIIVVLILLGIMCGAWKLLLWRIQLH